MTVDAVGGVEAAIAAFAAGEPVMVFDSAFRECETDLLWPATAATPEVMRRLRQDCGGLLFLAIGDEIGQLFDLPWLQDIHTHPALVADNPVLAHLVTNDLQYDTRSAFTLSVNHRDTYTGITDRDRSLTTRRFGELAGELLSSDVSGAAALEALGAEFRTPGHIPVCRESPGGLETRQGHTELAVAIARLAGQVPATIGAEMLEPDGDGALSVEDGREYAAKHSIPMITGADLLSALGIEE
jgi:3,4-dihydroxy 2-butanone 4-phosphate synthase